MTYVSDYIKAINRLLVGNNVTTSRSLRVVSSYKCRTALMRRRRRMPLDLHYVDVVLLLIVLLRIDRFSCDIIYMFLKTSLAMMIKIGLTVQDGGGNFIKVIFFYYLYSIYRRLIHTQLFIIIGDTLIEIINCINKTKSIVQ